MASATPRLHTLATKSLVQPCSPETLAYCPTMDLMALAMDDEVLVYRLNGEKVFGVVCAGDGGGVRRVDKVAWRADGEFSLSCLIFFELVWCGLGCEDTVRDLRWEHRSRS
jgi:Anaphase-promoting complex subunit 4 WD40 domain